MPRNFSETREQHERRVKGGMAWPDQHGRMWRVEIDTVPMAPVGIPYLENASPPIPIPNKYLNLGQFGKVIIEYGAWKRDILAREEEITQAIMVQARDMYGDKAQSAIDEPPPAILRIVGPRPIPIEFVMAMEAGRSPWVLGLRRADGSYHPKPSWVTPDLEERLKATQRRFAGGVNDTLPVAGLGQFADDPAEDVAAPEVVDTPFVDEPAAPVTPSRKKQRVA